MSGTTFDLDELIARDGDNLAVAIANRHEEYQQLRSTWLNGRSELRNYLFATDTRTTSNAALPWKNSTTIPKLTQIRDNLHANYMAALFPHSDWLVWEGDTDVDEEAAKREAIESYMITKTRQDNFTTLVSQLILDYIDYGNVFATAKWVDESVTNPSTGEVTRGYVGPRPVRISPNDITFNPLAPSFAESPKIIRTLKDFGALAKKVNRLEDGDPEKAPLKRILDKSLGLRKAVGALGREDTLKTEAFVMDGFGSAQEYFSSDYVEILTFYGDIYDIHSGEFLENHVIKVVDRMFILAKGPNTDWTSTPGIFHAGWRTRPDNLYAMGPLDNLVGMQYRMDHLENLKADVFDLIGHPVLQIKGFVEDFEYGPGAKIFVGDDGSVEFMSPDVTALNADSQIAVLEQRMEQLAGAPREAMGIRTPGEKTKFEVQTLDNAGSRIFQNKISHFEKTFLEKLLNYMLQLSRRNMTDSDVTRTLDKEIDVVVFTTITKDDIVANGQLKPRGASHFARQANVLQNVIGLTNSAVAQDPAVNIHLSGKKIAKLLEELMDLDRFNIFEENVRIIEQQEAQQLLNVATEQTEVAAQTPVDLTAAGEEEEV